MNWPNITIDHVKLICMYDVSKDEVIKEAFCGKKTEPFLKSIHQQNGNYFNFLDYQLQFTEAYQIKRQRGT